MLNLDDFKDHVVFSRITDRGGRDILFDFMKKRNEIDPISSILELGIGGGGKHLIWTDILSDVDDRLVFGVERFSPNSDWASKMTPEILDWNMQNYEVAIRQFDNIENLYSFFGYNSYLPESVNAIKRHPKSRLLDIIIDDSSANTVLKNPEKYNISDNWKDMIKQNGFIWSDTINGQGTDLTRNISYDDNMKVLKNFSEMGWVIFDMKKHSRTEESWKTHGNCIFAIWAHHHHQFLELYNKYDDCIILGKENIS
jgi:hypothetical protein